MTFNFNTVEIMNALLISIGIGVCFLCFMQITSSIHLRKEVRRYFQIFFILILIYISTHLARELMNGVSGNGIRIALYVVTFFEVLSAGFMSFMLSILIIAVTQYKAKNHWIEFTFLSLLVAHLLILAISWPFDFIYYFDASNVYYRGAGYLLSNVTPLVMLIIDIVLLIRYRKSISKYLKSALWIYMIAPIVAIGIQSFLYSFLNGLQLIIFATVGAAVYMFSVIIRDQNIKFLKQKAEKSRIESELSLATRIQADMLPNIYPAFPERSEFDIFASMNPAREVGGDFYDFSLIDDDHLYMVIADVSGKGVPAALFMMASRIILAINAQQNKTPAEILTLTNETICQNNKEEMFVTVWVGILEISTGKLTAANAGHEYPVLKQGNGKFEVLKDKHGIVIGGMSGIKYKEYEVQLEPGDKLFVYTDGVPEANNANNELFGMDRMVDALNANVDADPKEMLENVKKAVDSFVLDAEQFDDLTMLGLEYKGVKG